MTENIEVFTQSSIRFFPNQKSEPAMKVDNQVAEQILYHLTAKDFSKMKCSSSV
jgi:hypothetical protein